MNCPYYKVYILDGSKFCAWCGRKIFLSDEKLHNQTVKPATKVEGKTFGVIIGLVMFLLFGVSLCNERMNGRNPVQKVYIRESGDYRSGSDHAQIPKADGSFDHRRNDIDELSKEWYFYRKKILEAHQKGDEKAAESYRQSFQQVNRWLQDYKEEDVQDALSRNRK